MNWKNLWHIFSQIKKKTAFVSLWKRHFHRVMKSPCYESGAIQIKLLWIEFRVDLLYIFIPSSLWNWRVLYSKPPNTSPHSSRLRLPGGCCAGLMRRSAAGHQRLISAEVRRGYEPLWQMRARTTAGHSRSSAAPSGRRFNISPPPSLGRHPPDQKDEGPSSSNRKVLRICPPPPVKRSAVCVRVDVVFGSVLDKLEQENSAGW